MTGIDDREYHKTAPIPSTGRPSIYDLREPEIDIGRFLDEHIPLPRDGRVLDAGCGPGSYVTATVPRVGQLVALDIAHGRLAGIAGPARVAGDVQALPFPDGSFGAILAMHMLYHVPDIELGVREMRRVLRTDGVLYAFTNSERAQAELLDLVERHGCGPELFGDQRFCNENGEALLHTAFDDVSLVELTDTALVVTDAECIVDEVQRLRYALEPGIRAGVDWDSLVDACRSDVQTIIDRDGAFRMSENHGLFTCRARG